MKVRMLPTTPVDPVALASHAAKICYAAELPKLGSTIDVENSLFGSGHHTTLEHFSMTYEIDGVSVGDVDFGLHLTTPYYDTCQRSGRYARMFDNPNFDEFRDYILLLYPETQPEVVVEILDYIEYCLEIYNENKEAAKEVCERFLTEDKPHLTDAMLANSGKLAQEQMRCFIPVLVPTGLDYTIDLITLAGLYHTAWSPAMRQLTSLMATELLRVYPSVSFLFGERRSAHGEWAPEVAGPRKPEIVFDPKLKLRRIEEASGLVVPSRSDKFPIDQATTLPHFMNNEVGVVRAEVWVPLDLYGQDQRHRSNRRSMPEFTGQFYLPPIARELSLQGAARSVLVRWKALAGRVHPMLHATLAPYGAVIHYVKQGNLNAFAHEGGKRLCHLAQPGIYELNRQLRLQLESKPAWQKFLAMYEAPCQHGSCVEPHRYCGRVVKSKKDYYPYRRV